MFAARIAALTLLAGLFLQGSASAQTTPPPAPAPPPPPVQAPTPRPGDPFGEEVTLASKTIVYTKGSANWDSAFETLVEAFKKIHDALAKQGLKPSGPPMTIYTATDDTGFEYQAGVPVADEPKSPLPEGLASGKSPEGRALKFIHRGSYDAMDSTYEAIEAPVEALEVARVYAGIEPERFRLLRPGQVWEIEAKAVA